MIKTVFLDINYEKILEASYDNLEGSCIKHQVNELKNIHERYGGFPDSYDYNNTRIYQYWWEPHEIDFEEIGKQLNMNVVTVSSIKQKPGCIIPWHRDMLYQVSKKRPGDDRLKVRANIFVEDRKMGHLIETERGVVSHWRQGQGFLWDCNEEHLGANVGFEDKYTLQVSGFLIE